MESSSKLKKLLGDRMEGLALTSSGPLPLSHQGFVWLRTPVSIDLLCDETIGRLFEDEDDFINFKDEFPWEFKTEPLINMDWEKANPMFPSSLQIYKLKGASGWDFIFIRGAIMTEQPMLLSAVQKGNTRAIRYFLQELFRTNGKSFGVTLIGGPPSDITIHEIMSFDYLVDIFHALFDCMDVKDIAWQELLDNYGEAYFDFVSAIEEWSEVELFPSQELSKELDKFIEEYDENKPTHLGFPSGMAWSSRRAGAISEFTLKNEIADRVYETNLSSAISELERIKKPLIVAEYLKKVVNTGFLTSRT